MWCGLVDGGVVWCGLVDGGVVWCGLVSGGVVWCGLVGDGVVEFKMFEKLRVFWCAWVRLNQRQCGV